MLKLSRVHQCSFHGQAADIEWTLNYMDVDRWEMVILAPVDFREVNGKKEPGPIGTKVFDLTDEQAAATLALLIGDESIKSLSSALYEIAEQVWSGVDSAFRPIP